MKRRVDRLDRALKAYVEAWGDVTSTVFDIGEAVRSFFPTAPQAGEDVLVPTPAWGGLDDGQFVEVLDRMMTAYLRLAFERGVDPRPLVERLDAVARRVARTHKRVVKALDARRLS